MPDTPGTDFRTIQNRATCIFAPRARIESATPLQGADGRNDGQATWPAVAAFAARMEAEELDGLLIELRDQRCGETLDSLTRTMRALLSGLVAADGQDAEEALGEAGSHHWWLTLCGSRWFALAFAPCYPEASPRFTFGSQSTYVLLQPVGSFDRRATPKGSEISPGVRDHIRRAYATAGRPYDHQLAQQDVEALKFLWPLRYGDQPVQWWHHTNATREEPA